MPTCGTDGEGMTACWADGVGLLDKTYQLMKIRRQTAAPNNSSWAVQTFFMQDSA